SLLFSGRRICRRGCVYIIVYLSGSLASPSRLPRVLKCPFFRAFSIVTRKVRYGDNFGLIVEVEPSDFLQCSSKTRERHKCVYICRRYTVYTTVYRIRIKPAPETNQLAEHKITVNLQFPRKLHDLWLFRSASLDLDPLTSHAYTDFNWTTRKQSRTSHAGISRRQYPSISTILIRRRTTSFVTAYPSPRSPASAAALPRDPHSDTLSEAAIVSARGSRRGTAHRLAIHARPRRPAASAARPPGSPAVVRPTGRGESSAASVESTSFGALHDLESPRDRPQLPDDNDHDFDDHERRHPNTLMSTQPTASTAA